MEDLNRRSFSLLDSLSRGPLKVFIIGGGNWGTVISRIAASNANSSYIFDNNVIMWIYEEKFENQSLTEIINIKHENPKYLPGFTLPNNLIAVSEFMPHISEADLVVFVIPHQFVESVCNQIKCQVKPSAHAVSLLKGIDVDENGMPVLYSSIIEKTLNIPCSVMSGANVANDIAKENFTETTLGYKDEHRDTAQIWQKLFDKPYFKVSGVPDICGIEVCGALKNIVALSVGFSDALNYGTNTKAALIRIGVKEIKLFANLFFSGIQEETFLDSAGYADVITTCFGGRNVRCAAEFARRQGKDTWETIETEMLHGQKLQGQLTAKSIYQVIKKFDLQKLFPLFTITYKIAFQGAPITDIIQHFSTKELCHLKLQTECNACVIPESLKRKYA